MSDDPRRHLPAIDRLTTADLVETFGARRVTAAARAVVARARANARQEGVPELAALRGALRDALAVRVGPVINATGVVLHTNLGRAPWSDAAVRAAVDASGYAAVELDLRTGRRGARGAGVESRLEALTGAEASLVVNNGAAAILLALAGLAAGGRVLVSRGQLVEIGGGFRIPDILALSGATLVEVGTTNRTRLVDYERALGPEVTAVLWVHQANFRQVGFTSQATPAELAGLGLPLIVDVGSGALEPAGDEPLLTDAVRAGAAVVTASGDKLLGGPQAGLVLGKADAIGTLRGHPFVRAMRPDKVTLAALEATLDDWLLDRPIPSRALVRADLAALRSVVEGWAARLPDRVRAEVVDVDGAVGGGSLPGRLWPSVALAIRDPAPAALHGALLAGDPPVLGRVHDAQLLLDARTVVPIGQADALERALHAAVDVVQRS